MFNKKGSLLKNNQEQAVASWINYLNQVRLSELLKTLNEQNINLDKALETLNETLSTINKDIINNGKGRGGNQGMHGFIAEVAECGIGNAREEILGKAPCFEWINDNGPVDLKRGLEQIQQKFYNSGDHLSLEAIREHHEKYPWFLEQNGKYQIPKDHYDKIKYYLSISEETANKMPTKNGEFSLKQWKEVHSFFENGDIPLDKVEPSILKYNEVQKGTIDKTINSEKESIKKIDKGIRDNAYEKSKPSISEGAAATVTSAVIEGGTTFLIKVVEKRKTGKRIQEFDTDDWKTILDETGSSTLKGAIRGVSIYTLTNYTATPAAVASSIVTCSFGIAEQSHLFRNGSITEDEFLLKSETICLETSVSALSSFIGQTVIPIPVLGAVIGNTIGNIMYQSTKDCLSKHEQKLIKRYISEIDEYNKQLDFEYFEMLKTLMTDLNLYLSMIDKAFSPNYKIALEGSIQLAINLGVDKKELLKNIDEIDDYFLN